MDYKAEYEKSKLLYLQLQTELLNKNSMLEILYNDLSDSNSKLEHYKEMFSAANTNLLVNDKEQYELKEQNDTIFRENKMLIVQNKELNQELDELKELNESHKKYINSYYKITSSIKKHEYDEPKEPNNIDASVVCNERYELFPIDTVMSWLIDFINSACTFSFMKKHSFKIEVTQTNIENNKNITKQFKKNI